MSPKVLSLVIFVFAFLSFPSTVLSVEKAASAARTSLQPASSEMAREARDEAARVKNAFLVRKDSSIELSRQPLPWTDGPFRLAAFHVFPTQMPGPYIGPPTKLWDSGFGVSLWRNAVTGWPEM